ncbi:hypothetical protein PFISCL1PPCAC_4859, partial [Pristionchus fissidentatus]
SHMKTENITTNQDSKTGNITTELGASLGAISSDPNSEKMDVIIGCSIGGVVLLLVINVSVLVRKNRHGEPKNNSEGTSKGELNGGTSKQSDRGTSTPKTKTPSTKIKITAKETLRESQNEVENKRLRTHAPGSRVTGDIVYLNMEGINGEKENEANKNRAIPILNPFAA